MNIELSSERFDAELAYGRFAEEVEGDLERTIAGTTEPSLRRAAEHLCLGNGGKRVRPRLVWSFANCLHRMPKREDLTDVAVASELIHSGSLFHDDVLDQGRVRRGRPTANVKWGNKVAVLAGDMMMVKALSKLSKLRPTLVTSAVETIGLMTNAVIAEIEARGRTDLPLDHWRRIAEGKTGALFSWVGTATGQLAGDEEAAGSFAICGQRLGVAFQLADDLIDLVGEHSGKDRYNDLRNREVSYPILSAALASARVRSVIEELWRDRDPPDERVYSVGQQLATSDAVNRSVEQIDEEIDGAMASLGTYRDSPGGLAIAEWAALLLQQFRQTARGA